jgi:NAD(P)H-flavin reductase
MGLEDRDSLTVLRDAFDPSCGGNELAERFYTNWFAIDSSIRSVFPPDMAHQQAKFARTMRWVLDQLLERHTEQAVAFLAQLGRDHRRYGLTEPMYVTMHDALHRTVRGHLAQRWIPTLEATFNETVAVIVGVMSAAAAVETEIAWWDGSVVQHRRVSRDLAVVRLQLDSPMTYRAGQYLQVEIPQCPQRWRDLSPAIPSEPGGVIEFHVRAVPRGVVSNAIVSETAAGDRWRLSAPKGAMRIDPNGGDVLMIAGSTGVAPLRAMLLDMARLGRNPRVHLFFGARYPCELYDLPTLGQVASQHPWLSVSPVTECNDDPPWATEYPDVPVPPGLDQHQNGRLDEVVAHYGSWSDRQVLISGGPKMIAATTAALIANGTPAERIQSDLFT